MQRKLSNQILTELVSFTGVVVNTFSSRSEDSTGVQVSLPATAPSHVVTSDVIKHAATASDDSTHLLHYAAFASSVPLATSSPSSFPLQPAPSSSPGRAKTCPPVRAVDPSLSVGGEVCECDGCNVNSQTRF
jgi:hypothetical protein